MRRVGRRRLKVPLLISVKATDRVPLQFLDRRF